MVKRKIIKIDEDKCTGCGLCIPNCPEGALQIIDGKARVISDLFCDGLGACIGHCPEGAIEIEEREAEDYDENKVMANVVKQGNNVIKAHLEHLKEHNQDKYYDEAVKYLNEHNIDVSADTDNEAAEHSVHASHSGGCPGSRIINLKDKKSEEGSVGNIDIKSELSQWPVQLKLLNPSAAYFDNADLLVAADCVPVAYANFHQQLLKGKILVIFCPKLDTDIDEYIEKLAAIFNNHKINSITIAHMEVPCCFGTEQIVNEALKKSGKDIEVKKYTISIRGEII